MGVKGFWKVAKALFGQHIYQIRRGQFAPAPIDNFCIDLNGIVHSEAQAVYEYGEHAKLQPVIDLGPDPSRTRKILDRKLFQAVCSRIEKLVELTRPRKRLVLCIDGPVPFSKRKQQRQRRFLAASTSEQKEIELDSDGQPVFSSIEISTGTRLMTELSSFIREWIDRSMDSLSTRFGLTQIAFYSDRTLGEGEQNCTAFLRTCPLTETGCIHGLDADIIMLALASSTSSFFVLRDEMYDRSYEFSFIDIRSARQEIVRQMEWEETDQGTGQDPQRSIYDFVAMTFMAGNDFLPNIPSDEMGEDGVENMLQVYRSLSKHLVGLNGDLEVEALSLFFQYMIQHEERVILCKLHPRYFHCPILSQCAIRVPVVTVTRSDGVEYGPVVTSVPGGIDMKRYKSLYYQQSIRHSHLSSRPATTAKEISDLIEMIKREMAIEYIVGMQWNMRYYIGVPVSQDWKYPFHYAPFFEDLSAFASQADLSNVVTPFIPNPLLQLISIIPPRYSYLLPRKMADLFETSPLKEYCPTTFEIDLGGKHAAYEGIVLLPLVEDQAFAEHYVSALESLEPSLKEALIRIEDLEVYELASE